MLRILRYIYSMLFKNITIIKLYYIGYFLIPIICNSSINVVLEGLNPVLEYNVRKQFSKIDFNITSISIDFQKQLNSAIKSGLKSLGYYDPEISVFFDLQNKVKEKPNTLTIRIKPGLPIKINAINVNIWGDAQYDSDYQKIIKDSQLFIGNHLNHNDYEQFKNKLYNLAIYKGYFDSEFKNNQLVIIPSLHTGKWYINFDSGKRYIFEDIKFQGSQIKKNYLKNICNIGLGEFYNANSIIELNRRLSSTNWFESVLILPDFVVCSQKKKLILNVFLTPNVKNNFEIGSGYTSDIGICSKIIWKKPWINSYGHSLENKFSLSILEQFVDLSYRVPLLHNPLEQYYLIQGGWIHGSVYNLEPTQIITLNVARCWDYFNDWQRTINLHGYINHCKEHNGVIRTKVLICPGISVNCIQKKGTIPPYWGNSYRYSINASAKFWKSDINCIILQLQNIWIQKILLKNRFLARYNISWVKTNDISYAIPLFQLCFMKNRSIRGYENKFISTSHYLKYTKLITSTIEYQFHLFNKWWAAVFLDSGEITNKINWNNFKSGIGIGIRWQLPIGPLQLDIAIPLIHKIKLNHKLFYFYVNLGPEL